MPGFVGVNDEGVGLIVVTEVTSVFCFSNTVTSCCFAQVMKRTGATGDTVDLAVGSKVWRSFDFNNIS